MATAAADQPMERVGGSTLRVPFNAQPSSHVQTWSALYAKPVRRREACHGATLGFSLLLNGTMAAYLLARLALALRARRTLNVHLTLVALGITTVIPLVLFAARTRSYVGSTAHRLLSGLLDVYHSIAVIIFLSLLGAEVLVACESAAELERARACEARNVELGTLSAQVDAILSRADASAELRGALGTHLVGAECRADDWAPFSYTPFFFTLTVMTTVGYGTSSPETQAGRLFTAIFAICTIGVAVYCLARVAKVIESTVIWALSRAIVGKPRALERIFRAYDSNGSGALEHAEVLALLTDLHEARVLRVDVSQFEALVSAADRDLSGLVTLPELERALSAAHVDVRTFALLRHKTAVILALNLGLLGALTATPYTTQDGLTWSAIDKFYAATISLSTVGLGDLTLSSHVPSAVLFGVGFCVIGLGLFAALVSSVSDLLLSSFASFRARARRVALASAELDSSDAATGPAAGIATGAAEAHTADSAPATRRSLILRRAELQVESSDR